MMKIIIVEDDFRTAENLKNFITKSFVNVSVENVFNSGEEAVSYLRVSTVDLVLTDIRMPGITGIDLIKKVRLLQSDARIVVLSAYSDFDYIREAFLSGASDYLLKPIDRIELGRVLLQPYPDKHSKPKGVQETDANSEQNSKVISKVKELINERLGQSITLTELAESVYMNPQYLSSLFKEQTGENLISYVTRCRIELAKKMLTQSILKVYEIAAMCGYPDTKYFTSVFKKQVGLSPIEYRERANKS